METGNSKYEETVEVPDYIKTELASDLSEIIGRLDQYNLSTRDLAELLTEVIESREVQRASGGIKEDADDEGDLILEHTSTPLTQFTAACLVAEAADTLTHHYARKAHEAGYPWSALAEAAGFKSAQSAHWKWAKHPRDLAGYTQGIRERRNIPSPAMGLMPEVSRTTPAPQAEGWKTAAALGREMGHDARTIAAMGARGELEVIERAGPSGRSRSLYRRKK